jgi:adenylate cyclase
MPDADEPNLMTSINKADVLAYLLQWLVAETSRERFIDDILSRLCEQLASADVPVTRAALYFYTRNPEWLGARIIWGAADRKASITTFDYGIEATPGYLNSPVRQLTEGATWVRQRLDEIDEQSYGYDFYKELRDEGCTDYVAWPLLHTMGKRNALTFATDAPGGFSDDQLAILAGVVPTFALVSEIRIKNHMMRTLLNTYVGPHAAEEIIAGATTRGSGNTVRAAIFLCDLRGFTAISEQIGGEEVIGLLNRFFDTMSRPLLEQGGEILKFIGDGFLAMVPTTVPDACERLLVAVRRAEEDMAVWNAENQRDGLRAIDYGIGMHIGDVMYGNIGTTNRLDFTVIGRAVNVVARLEESTKNLKRRVLLSQDFVAECPRSGDFVSLGSQHLKGLAEPTEIFGLAG